MLSAFSTTLRTHQIRLHLDFIGHPISNDPNYGGILWHNNPDGRVECEKAQKALDSLVGASADVTSGEDKAQKIPDEKAGDGHQSSANLVTTDVPATSEEVQHLRQSQRANEEPLDAFIRRTCVWCARNKNRSHQDRSVLEFLVRSQGLFLHALQYSIATTADDSKTFSFRTDSPSWAELGEK